MEIKKNVVVFLQYQLRKADGELLEDTFEGTPTAVLQGQGNIISGLDQALLGHVEGDEFDVEVPPEAAYGLRQEDQQQRVPKKYFANPKKLRPGMQAHLQTKNGVRMVTVLKIGGKVIDVDTNHPLAGETLNFRVRIVSVREATPTEIAHKHAHADGDDHH